MRRSATVCFLIGAVILCCLLPQRVAGQAVNATLLGTVSDSSGAAVTAAQVTITEMRTGVKRSAVTNESGNYQFSDLKPGQYEIAVEQQGFKRSERTGLLSIYIPPIEAVQTVDVTTSNYDAELGRANGAITNVILKSGANEFHGAAYEINRISALAVKSFFQTGVAKAPSVYNYYGGNVGGALWRNKTFFFSDILRINDHQGQFFNRPGPPAALRHGEFSSGTVP